MPGASTGEPRVLLFTGKGGVGKSTVAAGTAALLAARGLRTLVLSTDTAHSLADAFASPAGPEPTPVAQNLWVQQVDTQRRFEESWSQVQGYLLQVLDGAGVGRVAAEELTVLPGVEEVLALLELRRQAATGRFDVLVVDCAPTAETLRLLALPGALGWYLDRVSPSQSTVVRVLGPVLTKVAGVPLPEDSVFEALDRLHAELSAVAELLTGPRASVRLVLTPEEVVLAEARRGATSLGLFGYRVDGVVANRVFPAEGADAWRAGWVQAQQQVLERVEESFAPLPVWRSPYRAGEPVGAAELAQLAGELYGSHDPAAAPRGPLPFRVEDGEEGPVLSLALPFVTRREVELARSGDELVLTVGGYRRLVTLPGALARRQLLGAGVVGGELRVRFAGADAGAPVPAGTASSGGAR